MSRANIYVMVMILLSMNLLLFSMGVRVIDNDNFLNRFINIDEYEQGVINVSGSLVSATPQNYDETRGGFVSNTLSFVDVIGAIKDFLIFIANIIFTPIGLFVGTGIPIIVTLLVGVPMIVAGLIALILLIRSG